MLVLRVILIFEVNTLNMLGNRPIAGLNGDSDVGFFLLNLKLTISFDAHDIYMMVIKYNIKNDKDMI
jgi:hypothetical protein